MGSFSIFKKTDEIIRSAFPLEKCKESKQKKGHKSQKQNGDKISFFKLYLWKKS